MNYDGINATGNKLRGSIKMRKNWYTQVSLFRENPFIVGIVEAPSINGKITLHVSNSAWNNRVFFARVDNESNTSFLEDWDTDDNGKVIGKRKSESFPYRFVDLTTTAADDIWVQTAAGAACIRHRTTYCEEMVKAFEPQGMQRMDGHSWIVQGSDGGYLVGHCLPGQRKYFSFSMGDKTPMQALLTRSGINIQRSAMTVAAWNETIRARLRSAGVTEIPVPFDVRTVGPFESACARDYQKRAASDVALKQRCDALTAQPITLTCPPTWSDFDKILAMLKLQIINSRKAKADPPPVLMSGEAGGRTSQACVYSRDSNLTAAQRTVWGVKAREYESEHLLPLFAGGPDRSDNLLPISPHFNRSYGAQETVALKPMRDSDCWGAPLPKYQLDCDGWQYAP